MIIASTWIKDLSNMNMMFVWILAVVAVIVIVGIATIVINGISRIYKIRAIHQERMIMIEKGMDPGPFVERSKESQEADAAEDAQTAEAGVQ